MREFLGSPIWQFIGTILAFLAIVLTIAIYYKQRQRKSLSYVVLSFTPLLSIREEIRGRVKILYDDENIQDAHLAVVKLLNSGTLPIASGDYERPVTFDFSKAAKILTSEIIETNPADLPANINVQEKKILLDPVLLNPSDSITFKVLLSGFTGEIAISGRIQGVKGINKVNPVNVAAHFREEIGVGSFVTGVLLLIGLSLFFFSQIKEIGIFVILGALINWPLQFLRIYVERKLRMRRR